MVKKPHSGTHVRGEEIWNRYQVSPANEYWQRHGSLETTMPQGKLLQSSVRGKLGSLKRSLRSRLAVEGVAWFVLALVALVFVTLGFDYMLKLDRLLRAALMILCLGGVGYILWRQMIAPMGVGMDEDNLALLVERHWKQLGDRLISALQFDRAGEAPPGTSPAMIEYMTRQANEMTGTLSFGEIVERRLMKRIMMISLAAVLTLGAFTAWTWKYNTMALWFQRNVLLADVAWPQKTYLQVQGDNFSVLRGDDLSVTVTAKEGTETPSYVIFHVNYFKSVGKTEERVDLSPDGRTFEKKFQQVNEEFTFFVSGGDDSLDERTPHSVTTIDPPSLQDMSYHVTKPAYMRAEDNPAEFQPVRGIMTVALGSRLLIHASANKDIKNARVLLDDAEVPDAKLQIVDKRRLLAEIPVGGTNKFVSRSLRFLLTDSENYNNRRGQAYVIQVQPDETPRIRIATRNIGNAVTPNAIIPLTVTINDDNGVSKAAYGVNLATGTGTTQPTSEPSAQATSEPARGTWTPGTPRDIDPQPQQQREYVAQCVANLEELSIAPRVGTAVTIFVNAADNFDPALGGPNAKSQTYEVKIASPEDVWADLIKRQQDIALEFFQALTVQAKCVSKTSGVSDALVTNAIPDTARADLTESSSGQIAVGTQCAKAAEQLGIICEEMKNNRLSDDIRIDLERYVARLKALAPEIDQITGDLGKAQAMLDTGKADPAELKKLIDSALEQQTATSTKIRDIYNGIVKGGNRQDVINQWNIYKKTWKAIMDATKGQIGQELHDVSKTQPASAPSNPK